MATIKEDYVSFEVAGLLKEKEFDWECIGYYVNDEPDDVKYSFLCETNSIWEARCYSAPTIQMAIKWLREVHNIDIFPRKIGKGIYSCAIFNSNTGQDLSSDKDFPSEKYEETAEAAIKYCLENLI